MPPTHEVLNQPPLLIDYDVADDPALLDALVRANTTRAVADGDGGYRLTGHKWFTSAAVAAVHHCRYRAAFRRLALAATKYWVCKRSPGHAAEALECLGGNGYIEDSGMPRLYREAPLASIWEGPGNAAALDVVRVLAGPRRAFPR